MKLFNKLHENRPKELFEFLFLPDEEARLVWATKSRIFLIKRI